jgi:hypothetical protein
MPRMPNHAPASPLTEILLPAYGPCPGFFGACQGFMKWDPGAGQVPRAFRGAIGAVEDVRLVLVCAEPGNPYPSESYEPGAAPNEMLGAVTRFTWPHLEFPKDQFARNIRRILDMAWPSLSFEDQMRRTWLTNSVLCSAPTEGAAVAARVENECRTRYLLPQLALFPNARIVCLGGKAQRRLARAGVPFYSAWAAAPPGSNRPEAAESWRRAVAGLACPDHPPVNGGDTTCR